MSAQAVMLATANIAMITTRILLIKKSSLLRLAHLIVGNDSNSSGDLNDRLVQKEHRLTDCRPNVPPHNKHMEQISISARKPPSDDQNPGSDGRATVEIHDIFVRHADAAIRYGMAD